jgi:hypothetical protein
MKFSVLALDYDGTIAQRGEAHPAVLEAIQEARSRRIVVVLVTGRILSDLKQAVGDLSFSTRWWPRTARFSRFPTDERGCLAAGHHRLCWMSCVV